MRPLLPGCVLSCNYAICFRVCTIKTSPYVRLVNMTLPPYAAEHCAEACCSWVARQSAANLPHAAAAIELWYRQMDA